MSDSAPKALDSEAYRLLVQEVRDYAIFILDVNGTVLTWNPGAQRLKGYAPKEIIGKHFSSFYPAEERESGKPSRELAQAVRDGRVEDEGWRLRKDGSRFWANVVITALHDDSGKLWGFAKITRDMTERRDIEEELRRRADELWLEIAERKQIEQSLRDSGANLEVRVAERTAELSRLNKDLADANRIKDEFLATLSHELRTPLTAIVGWVQMLRAGGLTDVQTKRALEVVDRNLTSQTKLIDDLLNISRIVSGKLKIDPQIAYPGPIIRETLESVKPSIEAKNLILETDIDSQAGPLSIDPSRFQQIVWNLLSNAVKFTPPNGSIHVRLSHYRGQAVFSVSDTGEGIASEFLPYVFDRFRQADSSRSRRYGGLGLGLAIVRHLVELHGGTVAVDSPGPGKGSTFSVQIPIPALPGAAVPKRQNMVESGTTLEGIRVLVLEDEVDTREMVVEALASSGAVVQEARSAKEALELLGQNTLDVLVSDIGIPDIDGIEFLRLFREMNKGSRKIPVVALTGYASEEDRKASLTAGFDAHLSKPVILSELIRTVATLHNRV